MKRVALSLLFMLASLATASAPAIAQNAPIALNGPLRGYYAYGRLQGMTTGDAATESMVATTIPMGPYMVTPSVDRGGGAPITGVVVGRSFSFHGNRTTKVPALIIPVKIVIPSGGGGGTFDPSVADSSCLGGKVPLTVAQNSPLFNNAPFTMNGASVGTTQYIDAFQRAEFWQNFSVTGDRYHVTLNPITTLSEQTFNVPNNEGEDATLNGCNIAIIDFATWDSFVQNTLIPFATAHGGGTTTFPFFLLYNVVLANPLVFGTTDNCCILGYHNAFLPGGNIQTYGVSDFDSTNGFTGTKDISPMSHEIGEWMNDPLGNNPTPAWGGIGQVSGCQDNFETGDPLSGTLFPSVVLSGFTYHPQEQAFFSWFYGGSSLGSGGKFSNNGTFGGDAKACPPGGTN